ncbi:unnamed protein product [Porites evermanni]|uniref:Uncharacterized protein n=1 Tax=Porites evermanni TaxID=104178 RepID=A0ABN8R4C7_9CNID|nr:unnamed protein product [Porites evermanni]
MTEGRFRFPKAIEIEELCVERAVPKCTRYKNKWAVGIFEDWQRVRSVKFPIGGRSLFLITFAIFRRILDAEMMDGTRAGVCLKAKKEMYCKL